MLLDVVVSFYFSKADENFGPATALVTTAKIGVVVPIATSNLKLFLKNMVRLKNYPLLTLFWMGFFMYAKRMAGVKTTPPPHPNF